MAYPGNERRRLPLNALRAFEAAAAKGNFTAGAQALSITQSALSRHVLALEQALDCRLFVRRGRGVVLTEAGERLLFHVSHAFDEMTGALAAVRQQRRMTLFVAPSFLQVLPPAVLQGLRKGRPDLQIDLVSENATGAGRQDADLAVTFEHLPLAPSHTGTLLWAIELIPVCSRQTAADFASHGLADLVAREELVHVRLTGHQPEYLWSHFARRIGAGRLPGGGIVFETQAQALEYVRAAGGLALADSRIVARLDDYGLAAPFPLRVPIDYGYVLSSHSTIDHDAMEGLREQLLALAT